MTKWTGRPTVASSSAREPSGKAAIVATIDMLSADPNDVMRCQGHINVSLNVILAGLNIESVESFSTSTKVCFGTPSIRILVCSE